jgi:hypothetical protein
MVTQEAQGLNEKQQFWLEHLQRCKTFSGTVEDYAAANGLSLTSLYAWRKRLIEDQLFDGEWRQQTNRFKKVAVVPRVADHLPCRICLPNGIVVEWPVGDHQGLEAVLRVALTLS